VILATAWQQVALPHHGCIPHCYGHSSMLSGLRAKRASVYMFTAMTTPTLQGGGLSSHRLMAVEAPHAAPQPRTSCSGWRREWLSRGVGCTGVWFSLASGWTGACSSWGRTGEWLSRAVGATGEWLSLASGCMGVCSSWGCTGVWLSRAVGLSDEWLSASRTWCQTCWTRLTIGVAAARVARARILGRMVVGCGCWCCGHE
jgi:hypothetical protein